MIAFYRYNISKYIAIILILIDIFKMVSKNEQFFNIFYDNHETKRKLSIATFKIMPYNCVAKTILKF
jgi:hypothetical protein